MMLTKDFCEKRVKEQTEYIDSIMAKALDGTMTHERSLEIIRSAIGVKEYFSMKLQSLKRN